MQDVLSWVIDALERRERLALITAIRSVGSTPRHAAARLAVFTNRAPAGSIGGGTMEREAIADAQRALDTDTPCMVEYNLTGRGEGNLGMCGGTQEFFIDVLHPAALAHWRALHRALAQGEPVVLARIVRAENSALPIASAMVLRQTGERLGTLGNAQLDDAVASEAQRAMNEHHPQRLAFDPHTGTLTRLLSTRRAPIEIFLDLFEPPSRLVIIGAGHIGQALAQVGKFLHWHVEVVDDRADFLTPERFPSVDALHLVEYAPQTERLSRLDLALTPNTAVVIATWGWDEPALRALAHAPVFYLGLVASLRKAALIFAALRNEGIDADWLNQIRVPVGLDLGAETPEEIALAIMAEILATWRGKSSRPLREINQERWVLLNAHKPASIPTPVN